MTRDARRGTPEARAPRPPPKTHGARDPSGAVLFSGPAMNLSPPVPDTIFALATAPGRAGIAVLRLSGPSAHDAAQALAGPLPEHGRSLRTLRDPSGEALDQALVLTFAPHRSFTGEAVAELHCHGAPAVVAALLRTLGAMPGLRPAEPWRTAAWTSRRSRASPTSSRPKPRPNAAKPCVSSRAPWAKRPRSGAPNSFARSPLSRPPSTSPTRTSPKTSGPRSWS